MSPNLNLDDIREKRHRNSGLMNRQSGFRFLGENSFLRIALGFLFGMGLSLQSASANLARGDDEKVVVNAEIVRSGYINPEYKAMADLGFLDCGRKYVIDLVLVNRTKNAVGFSAIRVACNCSTIDVNTREFLPDQPATVRLKLSTPRSSSTNQFVTFFSFVNAESVPVLDVTVQFALRGNLEIDRTFGNVLELTGDFGEWELPVTVSAPVQFENLVVEKSPGFANVIVELRQADDGCRLKIAVPRGQLDDAGSTGWIAITDRVLEARTQRDFLITLRPPVLVSPTLLRFSPDTIPTGNAYANVLVRVNPNANGGIAKLARLECRIGDDLLEVESREIGKGIYRLKVIAPLQLMDDSETQALVWGFELEGGQVVTVKGSFFRSE